MTDGQAPDRPRNAARAAFAAAPRESRRLRRVVVPLLLVVVAVLLWRSGLAHELDWAALGRHQARLRALVAAHPFAAAAGFVAIYTAMVALSVPESALITAIGGLMFGPWLGGGLSVLGATLGAVALFVIARTALAGFMARRAQGLLARIRPGLERDGFSYLLALRLLPLVPFWLVNLGAALCGMRLFPYALATLVGIVPVTLVFAWIGAGVGSVLEAGGRPDFALVFSPSILGPLLALAALALAPVLLRRMRRRRR
ncbi:MAG: TVP38/TMEM64 family protein [Rhodospirillales bacterium]|nr:TVP38/TMEM64 family protein [Rhodospirillales bacterium]